MPFMIAALNNYPSLYMGMSIFEPKEPNVKPQKTIKTQKVDSKSTFAETFLKMVPSLRRITQRILISGQDTDDLLQEAFIRGMGANQKRDIESLEDYLFIITRNLALKERAKQKDNLANMLAEIDDSELACSQPQPDECAYNLNRFNAFIHAANTLPEQCKRAFLLRHLHGYSQKDIAHAMRISESTVEKHLAKGLRRCANELEELGYSSTTKNKQGRSLR